MTHEKCPSEVSVSSGPACPHTAGRPRSLPSRAPHPAEALRAPEAALLPPPPPHAAVHDLGLDVHHPDWTLHLVLTGAPESGPLGLLQHLLAPGTPPPTILVIYLFSSRFCLGIKFHSISINWFRFVTKWLFFSIFLFPS